MAAPTNSFKAALAANRVQIGVWQAMASPVSAEICAGAGFDWMLFDGEHGPNDIPLLMAQLQAVAPYPVHAAARVPVGDTHLIKQYLDVGVTTLLVPMVETAEQATELVRAVRYPPAGMRGVGASVARAARWGRVPDYLATADAQVCLLVQVESKKGLANLSAIAAVEGVDGVFIGPSDLSAALGHIGQPGHPEVVAQIEPAIAAIRTSGKAAGIMATDPALARRYLDQGVLFVAVATDTALLARATSEIAAQFKGAAPPTSVPGGGY